MTLLSKPNEDRAIGPRLALDGSNPVTALDPSQFSNPERNDQ